MSASRLRSFARYLMSFALFALIAMVARAGAGGSISGTVRDASGAAIPKAAVTATNTDTGIQQTSASDDKGFYSLASLPVGHYDLEVTSTSFKPYRHTGIAVDANSALSIDAVLEVGGRSDIVTVSENQLHVETTSTQMGEVITGAQMTAVPLNGRSFTDLLTLQPGVAPVTSITSDTVQDVGASVLSPSGDLNPGTISINGQREFANAFIVNGSDAEEDVNMGAAIIPNLDSIAEFRILTNNFDAEYGEFSGGQINVVTKSGANLFHGNAFEFLRNTNLDARNYFSPTRGAFNQNQFGGTFGGPISKDKVFFFADYQGTRSTQGVDTGQIRVPSTQDRTGNLSDLTGSFVTTDANGNTVPTTVSGTSWANQLSQKFGYPVSAGEAYYTPGCTSATCAFPGAIIPQTAWSAPATNLLKYIPSPSNGNGTFSTSSFNQTLRDDKGAYRLDANTRWGLMSAYYFLDDWSQNNPYPIAQGGANVPGFNALYTGRAQLLELGDTK
ncbi:MAG: carboxypeptidase-like regulatory domain-containing protein, partial [Candidatus Acidiferrales bacterium]